MPFDFSEALFRVSPQFPGIRFLNGSRRIIRDESSPSVHPFGATLASVRHDHSDLSSETGDQRIWIRKKKIRPFPVDAEVRNRRHGSDGAGWSQCQVVGVQVSPGHGGAAAQPPPSQHQQQQQQQQRLDGCGPEHETPFIGLSGQQHQPGVSSARLVQSGPVWQDHRASGQAPAAAASPAGPGAGPISLADGRQQRAAAPDGDVDRDDADDIFYIVGIATDVHRVQRQPQAKEGPPLWFSVLRQSLHQEFPPESS